MLRLRMLGGLWLEREDGSTVDIRARWLALLALIAAAEDRGISRDQLLGILWPELDQARGSHNLSQVLYSLKQAAGSDLITPTAHVYRLNKREVNTDLAEFRAMAAQESWAHARRLSDGAFLAGFYLEDAPAYERWAAETRDRVSREVEAVIERHAELSEQRGEGAEARASWQRLTELDPINSRFAYQYVLALAMSGDRGGAVRHGLAHTALIRSELDTAPSTRLTELLERLQRGNFVSSQGFTQAT